MNKFWFVMHDVTVGNGSLQANGTLPHVRHSTLANAEREAERLARSNPDNRFIVLEAVSGVTKSDVQWEKAEGELPF